MKVNADIYFLHSASFQSHARAVVRVYSHPEALLHNIKVVAELQPWASISERLRRSLNRARLWRFLDCARLRRFVNCARLRRFLNCARLRRFLTSLRPVSVSFQSESVNQEYHNDSMRPIAMV